MNIRPLNIPLAGMAALGVLVSSVRAAEAPTGGMKLLPAPPQPPALQVANPNIQPSELPTVFVSREPVLGPTTMSFLNAAMNLPNWCALASTNLNNLHNDQKSELLDAPVRTLGMVSELNDNETLNQSTLRANIAQVLSPMANSFGLTGLTAFAQGQTVDELVVRNQLSSAYQQLFGEYGPHFTPSQQNAISTLYSRLCNGITTVGQP